MNDEKLALLLLSTIVNSVSRFICSMAVYTISNIKMKLSDWVKQPPYPDGLPKVNFPGKFVRFIIFYNGRKYYITDLEYFSQPSTIIKKLLNNLNLIVATWDWQIAYKAIQWLYGQPDPIDPAFKRTGHKHFMWGRCRAIVNLHHYYEDHINNPLASANLVR